MKRKAVWAAIGILPTLIAANLMPRFVLYGFCIAVALIFAITLVIHFKKLIRKVFYVVSCILLAAIVFLAQYESVNYPLRANLGQKITAQALCTNSSSYYATFRIQKAAVDGQKIWMRNTFVTSQSEDPIELGDIATVQLRYVQNDGAITLSELEILEISSPDKPSLAMRLHSFRTSVINTVQTKISGEEGALSAAILTGDKSNLSDVTRTNFVTSGLSHVMAVSGLHLSIFLAMLIRIADKFSIPQKWMSLLSLFMVVFVAILADFSVSVMRAGIMSLIMLVGQLINRRADSINSLFSSLIFIGLFFPGAVLEASYLLSGAATAGILVISPWLEDHYAKRLFLSKPMHRQLSLIFVSFSSSVFTAPILILYFSEISILSIPAMSIVNYPITILLIGTMLGCCLFWFPYVGEFVAFVVRLIAGFVLDIIELISSFDQPTIPFHSQPMIVLAILLGILCLMAYLLRHSRLTRRCIAAAAMVCCTITVVVMSFYSSIFSRIIAIDGRGECSIYINNGQAIVVNCSSSAQAYQAGKELKRYGFSHIDLLIVSGIDAKQAAGVAELMSNIPAENVIVYDKNPLHKNYRNIIDVSNRVGAKIYHLSDYNHFLQNQLSVEFLDFYEENGQLSIMLCEEKRKIGFLEPTNKYVLQGILHPSCGFTDLDALILNQSSLNALLLRETRPRNVIIYEQSALTANDKLMLTASGANYASVGDEFPKYILDLKEAR